MAFSPRKLPDPAVIKSELAAVCSHPLFINAPGAVSLLRFLVENDLRGSAQPLRETTIGIKLYGRDPAYDPKLDAIVRVNATRLRNRLEHYYATQPHAVFRISLPAGGYMPMYEEFIPETLEAESDPPAPLEPLPPAASLAAAPGPQFRWWLVLVILITAIAAVVLTLLVEHRGSATGTPQRQMQPFAGATLAAKAEPRLDTSPS